MLEIWKAADGVVHLKGRMDAAQSETAHEVMDEVEGTCDVDFSQLEYISSAGLKVLLATQQRLMETGDGLRLRGMTPHVRMVFEIAGFDSVFTID